jgi:hypothetical protein
MQVKQNALPNGREKGNGGKVKGKGQGGRVKGVVVGF